MAGKAEIEIARLLFEKGWGGDDPSAPLEYMTDDVVMRDILGHPEALRGHEAVRSFWQAVAGRLTIMPEEYFTNERGVALGMAPRAAATIGGSTSRLARP
jgi:ketosteroid isomerase-like protein